MGTGEGGYAQYDQQQEDEDDAVGDRLPAVAEPEHHEAGEPQREEHPGQHEGDQGEPGHAPSHRARPAGEAANAPGYEAIEGNQEEGERQIEEVERGVHRENLTLERQGVQGRPRPCATTVAVRGDSRLVTRVWCRRALERCRQHQRNGAVLRGNSKSGAKVVTDRADCKVVASGDRMGTELRCAQHDKDAL